MTKNYSDITVILTLYKTPENKLKNLNQYKKYKTIFFDQESNGNLKNKIRYFFKGNFKYYSSLRNIGLSKSSNFLLSKVKTRYCLFTQPDIKIYDTSILMLKKHHTVLPRSHREEGFPAPRALLLALPWPRPSSLLRLPGVS